MEALGASIKVFQDDDDSEPAGNKGGACLMAKSHVVRSEDTVELIRSILHSIITLGTI